MKNPKPPSTAQGRALANIDRALEKLEALGVPEAELQEFREAREILGGAPLDPIEAMVADLIPGSVDDMDFEAVEAALWDGSHLAVRDALERRLDADRADGGAEPKCGCGAEPDRKGRKKKR